MPKLMVYKDGDVVPLKVTVVSGRDQGGVVIDIGGLAVPISSVYLDRADVRPASLRPLTDEEQDRAEMARTEREAREQARAAAEISGRGSKAKAAEDASRLAEARRSAPKTG